MRKDVVIKRVLLGFVIGVFISYTLDIALSIMLGKGVLYSGIENIDNKISIVIIRYFVAGIIGMLLSANLWIFGKEEWSIAFQTFAHFLIAEIAFIIYIISIAYGNFTISPVVFYQLIIIVTYLVIWVVRSIYWNYQVKKIRIKMQQLSDENFLKINSKMKINNILLKAVLAIVFVFLIIILIFIYKNIVAKKIGLSLLESTNLTSVKIDEENNITSIYSRFDEGKTKITINNISNIRTIDEVEEILGKNYYDGIYDWEQLLYSYVYYDRENGIIAEFVYCNFNEESENNRLLTWIDIYKK